MAKTIIWTMLALVMVTSTANASEQVGCISGKCENGAGTYVYDGDLQGQRYEGEWLSRKRHGQGVHYYPDGRYAGQWQQDKRSGKGDYLHVDGHR